MRGGPTLVTQRPLSTDHLRSPAITVSHPPSAPVAGTGALAARFDVACAVAAGAAALVVYGRTLAPGLIALLDTPMFQFIGRVLGVPHNPGYPLYVMLTYPIARIPLGSLPYRINLFSSVFAAVTVSLVFFIARRLGCRPTISMAVGLGLAFGKVFWSQAVIAEVYTLHAAIVAGVVLSLLAWRQTRRQRWFFAAIAVFAAGLGNHTTIVALAPGIAVYVLMIDRGFAMRLRTLAATAAILVAGILQYAFILIRSHQPGTYVESRATTPGALLDVMLGRQFSDRLFAFDWQTVLRGRFPSLVEHVLVAELTIPGVLLAAAGAAWLLRHRLPEGLLLLPIVGTVVGFAVNYRVVDTPVFVIPGILVLWLAAGAGAEAIARAAAGIRLAPALCSAAVLMLPVWNLTQNYAANDRSRDTAAATHFDALFEALPRRTVLVHEDFLIDRMVMFKLLGDNAARGRQIELAPFRPDILRTRLGAGFEVFAFRNSARRLRHHALNVCYQPLALTDGLLPDFLRHLTDGMVVAIAIPSGHAQQFVASGGADFTAIGGPQGLLGAPSNVAITGTRGKAHRAVVRSGPGAIFLNLPLARDTAGSGPARAHDVQIQSRDGEAAIIRGSRDLLRTTEGAAVAVWTPQGRLAHAFVLRTKDAFRVPIAAGALSVYPVRGVWSGQEVPTGRWADVRTTMRTGSLMVRVPPGGTAVFYAGNHTPLSPRVFDRSSDRSRIEIAPFENVSGSLRARMAADGVNASALDSDEHAYRIEIQAPDAASVSALLAMGGIPRTAIGRATLRPSSSAASVFSIDTAGLLRTPDAGSEVLLMARDDQAQLTGYGWSAVDHDAVGPYRWITAAEGRLVLPIAGPAPRAIRLQAMLDGAGTAATVALRVNRTELPAQALRAGWHTYEWSLPPASMAEGTNEAAVIVEGLPVPTDGNAGAGRVAVSEVRVLHEVR
jgi:hypothetical protein